jgi:uncharacterized protein with PIN domain
MEDEMDLGEPKEGRYADADWQPEHSDVIRCPDCGGKVEFKDWEDSDGKYVATHYRCNDCRTNWWTE